MKDAILDYRILLGKKYNNSAFETAGEHCWIYFDGLE
jgi:hypothetical protein